jgi:hypothetical protein
MESLGWDLLEWRRLCEGSDVKHVTGHYAEQLEYIFHKYRVAPDDPRVFTRRQLLQIYWFIHGNFRIREMRFNGDVTKHAFYKRGEGVLDMANELSRRLNEIFWDDRL